MIVTKEEQMYKDIDGLLSGHLFFTTVLDNWKGKSTNRDYSLNLSLGEPNRLTIITKQG